MTENAQHKRRLPAYFYKGSTVTGLILVIVLAIGAILVLSFGDRLQTFLAGTGNPPAECTPSPSCPGAKLRLVPATSTVTTGGTFTVDIMLDAGNDTAGPAQISTVAAYLSFDKSKLNVVSPGVVLNTTDAATARFDQMFESNTNGTALTNAYDNTNGKIRLTAFKNGTTITGSNIKVGTITFSAIGLAPAPGTDVTFDFTSRSAGPSMAVISTTTGDTDSVLQYVAKGTFIISPVAPTAPSDVRLRSPDGTETDAVLNNRRSANKFRFTYTAVPNATTYSYRVIEEGTSAVVRGSTPLNTTTTNEPGDVILVDTLDVINGKTYKIEVKAENASGSTLGFSALVKTTSPDVNSDGSVNTLDVAVMVANYGATPTNSATSMPNIDGTGTVNTLDLAYISSMWNTTGL